MCLQRAGLESPKDVFSLQITVLVGAQSGVFSLKAPGLKSKQKGDATRFFFF